MSQYDPIATAYENLMGGNGDIPRRDLIDPLLINLLPKDENLTVLDVGCGNGYWTKILADKYKKIIAIDNSKKLLEIARNKRSSKNIKYKFEELEDEIKLPDNAFDLIFSNMVAHYIKNIDTFAKEMYKLIKKDGTMLVSITHPLFESKRDELLKSISKRTPYQTTTLNGLAKVMIYYEPLDKFKKHFTDIGFSLVLEKEAIITNNLIAKYARYAEYVGLPRAAIFIFKK